MISSTTTHSPLPIVRTDPLALFEGGIPLSVAAHRPSSRMPSWLLVCAVLGLSLSALGAADPGPRTGDVAAEVVAERQFGDLLGVMPITDRIVAFHLRDGHVVYPQVGEDGSYVSGRKSRAFYEKVIQPQALERLDAYRVESPDDPAFAAGLAPLRVGYKGKGDGYMGPDRDPPYLREYLVYAELPHPLKPGCSYHFDLRHLAGNAGTAAFVFDVAALRSPTIQVSQVGFTPDAPKFAFLSQWMGTFASSEHPLGALNLSSHASAKWRLVDVATGDLALQGQGLRLQQPKDRLDGPRQLGNWSGADVYEVDFTALQRPGRYVLVVDGIGRSFPFRVSVDAYRPVYQAASRALFFQRTGIERDVPEFSTHMPRGQHPDDLPFKINLNYNSYTNPKQKTDPPGFDRPVRGIWGWYADAADWDHYVGHYKVPMAMLLLFNLKPDNFQDGDVGNRYRLAPNTPWIEEAGNGLPDLLDEARWLIDFARRTRRALMDQGLGTGGLPGYVGIEAGHGAGPSWTDPRMQAVGNEMPNGTYGYAACAAYLAYTLDHLAQRSGQPAHPESQEWLKEAHESFRWAEETTRPRDAQTPVYRALAAAALYAATGEQRWEGIYREAWQTIESARWQNHPGIGSTWRSPSEWMLAGGLYLEAAGRHKDHDPDFYRQLNESWIARTDRMTNSYASRGYRFGGIDPEQGWTRGMIGQPRTLMQAVAYHVTGERKYIDEMHAALAYMLGGNQDGRSRISGLGHRHEDSVFHIDSWYLLSFNHPAYDDPILPGYCAPGLRDAGFDLPAHSSASEDWARTSAVPGIGSWPLGEQRMYSRWSVAASEFTITENLVWWVFAAGYLIDPGGQRVAYQTPQVTLEVPEGGLVAGRSTRLHVKTGVDTYRVRYFADWRLIGDSFDRASGFTLPFDPAAYRLPQGSEVRITAVAQDWDGRLSVPSDAGEKMLRIASP